MIKQSIFSNLLRIMTPEEINILTKNFDRTDRISLMSIVTDDLSKLNHTSKNLTTPTKAKILPLTLVKDSQDDTKSDDTNNKEIKNKDTKNKKSSDLKHLEKTLLNDFSCGPIVTEMLAKFSAESLENENNIFSHKRKTVVEVDEKYESTEFILSELNKTQKNNDKLKKLNVWKLYTESSVVDIDISKGKDQDKKFSESSTKGILINKRQA